MKDNTELKIKTRYRRIRKDFSLRSGGLFGRLLDKESRSAAPSIPVTWDRAENFCIRDDRGNQWIDLTSGIFVTNAGHGNPLIKRAIKQQLRTGVMFAYNYPTHIKARFLTKLLEISPSYFNKVILLNSGSEAVDAAYKLVKLWGRAKKRKFIVSFRGSYHGRGLSNDLICGHEQKAAWSGVNDDSVVFLDFPYDDRASSFDPALLPPPKTIAAFFLETFQGWNAWFYPNSYINRLAKFARENGILLVFDEMQSGFYRLGPLFGYMTYGPDIQPDIICVGKGISSSLPISAVLSREEIVDLDPKNDLFGTHSGNPLCCAAALANLEFLSDPEWQKDFQKRKSLFERLVTELSDLPLIKRVNVRGMIAALLFKSADSAYSVVVECIKNGVLPVCTMKPSIKLAPPLTITENAIYESAGVIRKAAMKIGNK